MGDEFRLLISARDAGAAHHLAPVMRLAMRDPAVQPVLVASEPALGILRALALPVQAVAVDGTAQLQALAHQLLEAYRPHAVLTGLSGPDRGIDEALLAAARVPTFALQDFWGDVNAAFGRFAMTYLVRDALAADLTLQRSGSAALVVGSTPQQRLPGGTRQRLWRRRLRAREHLRRRQPLLLLCGQPLWDRPGYRQTLIDTLQQLPSGRLLVRPHPRENAADRRRLRLLLGRHCRIRWHFSRTPLNVELAAADLVLSAFSNTGLDRALLNLVAPTAAGVPVYLLHDRQLRTLFHDWTGLRRHPLVSLGAAVGIERRSMLRGTLDAAAAAPQPYRCAQGARALRGPADAAQRVLDAVTGRAQPV